MAIYRGPGGPGDATADSASTAQLAQTYATNAENSATAAATSATNAASSATAAASSATTAANSATAAATSATNAASSATAASASATAAASSAGNAEAFATAAEISAGNAEISYQNTLLIFGNAEDVAAAVLAAETSAGNAEAFSITAFNHAGNAEAFAIEASGYATAALSHAGNADTSATAAASSASAAATSATNAEAAYDSFDDRYLGAKSSAPSTDNDGNALLTGALYWNSSLNQLYIWDGASWNAAALDVSGAVTSFNTRTGAVTLSSTDVTNALTYTPFSNAGGTLTGSLTAPGATISASFATFKLISTGNLYSRIDFGDAADGDIGQIYYDHPNNAMKFSTNNVERMAISNAGDVSLSSVGAIKIPTGTNAQRPGTPATGQLRFNTDTAGFEGYDGSTWGEIGGGLVTTLSIFTRAETVANVALTNGTLPVTDRSGSTVLVSVS